MPKRRAEDGSEEVVYKKAKGTKAVGRPPPKATGRRAVSGSELKFFDTATAFNFDATGEVPATGQLNLIPQGVTESTRVGRKCVLKSIAMKGTMSWAPGAATNTGGSVFLYVVLDRQANSAAAAATDVFTGTNFGSSYRNLSNSDRFQILKMFEVTFNPEAGVQTAFGQVNRRYSWYSRCDIPLEFGGTTGAITEIRSNNLFLLAGTDGTSDDTIAAAGVVRVRFSDGS